MTHPDEPASRDNWDYAPVDVPIMKDGRVIGVIERITKPYEEDKSDEIH